MFAGHFGVAAAVKAKCPEVPLWALMAGTQLADIIFVPLFIAGIETMETPGGPGYGHAIIHADYTHSIVGMLLLSMIAGLLAAKAWGRRAGIAIGAVVFSHWLLDLFVHRMDMPILPGNFGNLPLLGFGLWELPAVSAIAELAIITIGMVMYASSLRHRSKQLPNKMRGWVAGLAMGILLIVSLAQDVFGT